LLPLGEGTSVLSVVKCAHSGSEDNLPNHFFFFEAVFFVFLAVFFITPHFVPQAMIFFPPSP